MRIRSLLPSLLTLCLSAVCCLSSTAQDKVDTTNIIIGKIGGYTLVYDCYGCEQTHGDSVVIYARKAKARTKLFSYDLASDNYIIDVKMVYLLHHPFIYVTAGHTYGHFFGNLYAFDLAHLETLAVGTLPGHVKSKMPKNLEFKKANGIRLENNKILDGAYYTRNGDYWTVDNELQLIRLGNNYYKLKPVKEIIVHDNNE